MQRQNDARARWSKGVMVRGGNCTMGIIVQRRNGASGLWCADEMVQGRNGGMGLWYTGVIVRGVNGARA